MLDSPTEMSEKTNVHPIILSAIVFLAEVIVVVIICWAGTTTFIIKPGRFYLLEPLLESNVLVLFVPAIAGTFIMGRKFSMTRSFGKLTGYTTGAIISIVALATAMFIGLNIWDS